MMVRMPNGLPLALRERMTRPEAAWLSIRDRPRLVRETLSDLGVIVDSFL